MKDMNQAPRARSAGNRRGRYRQGGSGDTHGGSNKTRNLNQAPLNTGLIHISPVFALLMGVVGFGGGLLSNGVQVWTTQNAFMIMLMTSGVYLNMLKKDPVHAAGLIPIFNGSSWILAAFIQLGVLFFTLRVAHEFKEQMSKTQGNSAGRRLGQAGRQTAVAIVHNRDFFFYYGIACFIANCLGDYGFVFSFTDSVEFLAIWGIALTATSTMIMALGAEFLWAGYNAWRHARAEWEATYVAALARSRNTGGGS